MSSEKVISVLRRPDGLFTLVSGPRARGGAYAERLRPLEECGRRYAGLLASWRALARVRWVDASVLRDVRAVLAQTVSDVEADVAPLHLPREPESPKRTAAHPRPCRAHRSRLPAPIDLRPHLCVPRDVSRLLGRPVGEALPPLFRRSMLGPLRGRPAVDVNRALGIYWALRLENYRALRRCVSRLLATGLPAVLDWCDEIARQPSRRRVRFAVLVVESGVARMRPDPAAIERVDRATGEAQYRPRMFALLKLLRDGKVPDYFLDGVDLAELLCPSFEFKDVGDCVDFPLEELYALTEYMGVSGEFAMSLWRHCGTREGFDEMIRRHPWRRLSPGRATEFFEILMGNTPQRWVVLRAWVPAMFEMLGSAPTGFRGKMIAHLREIVNTWDHPVTLNWALEAYRDLLPRLCRSPFDPGSEWRGPRLLAALVWLPTEEWREAAAAPDASFLALERAAKRENEVSCTALGLAFLSSEAPETTAYAFRESPRVLLRVSRKLCALGRVARRELLKAWRAHPLVRFDPESHETMELARLIERRLPDGIVNPVPRKLRDFLAGAASMRPGQLARARRVMLGRIRQADVELLGRLADERLGATFGVRADTQNVRHALRMCGHIRENRRSLRRFLRAWFEGDQTYIQDHSANRRWLERHPRIDVRRWLEGITTRAAGVELRLESDPLEALRLGTHVGSCLGLGGAHAYSAAAVVLDINKQVIYARDAAGAVVGRQLVALSERDRLVCFSVYPATAPNTLSRVFSLFDRRFARALGVEIGDMDDNIALLVASDWYDDFAWDLKIESADRTAAA